MATLIEMFYPYLADVFPEDAKFVDDSGQSLRIIYPINESEPGKSFNRPIVIVFEILVITECQAAIDSGNVLRQDRIGDALCEIVNHALEQYDVHGACDSAFTIQINLEATGL